MNILINKILFYTIMNLIVGLLFIIFILIGVFYLSNIELYRNKDYNKIKDIVINN